MNKTVAEESTQIEVEDFGPIVNAKINLRPMTVFVGPSNTGKSYLAILIYALHRFFASGVEFSRLLGRSRVRVRLHQAENGLSDEIVSLLLEVARKFAEDPDPDDRSDIALAPEIADALRVSLEGNANAIAHEIGRCFGVGDLHTLVRKGRAAAARVTVRRQMSGESGLDEHVLTLGRKARFRTAIHTGAPIPVNGDVAGQMEWFFRHHLSILDEELGDTRRRRLAAEEILGAIGNLVLPAASGVFRVPAFYLPADRTGVMHAHSAVVSALIANAPVAGMRPAARTPMLSGVLADFLERLIEISPLPGARSKSDSDFGARIEKSLLDGTVHVNWSPPAGYPEFAYRPKGWKEDLALANASSMVSELAPVILYLRHLVRPGDVLIVEEPEAHLHPSLQVAFTHQLAALANAGIRVIVTTHSEWLLEALANIMLRSERSERQYRRAADGQVALGADQVGVWLFEPKRRPRGSVVREIRIDDSGLFPSGYEDVAAALHNEWADMSSETGTGP